MDPLLVPSTKIVHLHLPNCTCCMSTHNFIVPDVLLGTAGLDNSENIPTSTGRFM